MQDFTLEIKERSEVGSSHSRSFRRDGWIPAVVYSRAEESVKALVSYRSFVGLARKATSAQVFSFKSESQALDGRMAIVKEIQKNVLDSTPQHIDFLALKKDQKVTVRAPLQITGEPFGVKNEGGVLTIAAHELLIECLPAQIPSVIELDSSELKLGESLHAKDVGLPEGVEFKGNPEETLVSVVASRTSAQTEQVTETEAADGEAAAGAEAAAADDSKEGTKPSKEPKEGES